MLYDGWHELSNLVALIGRRSWRYCDVDEEGVGGIVHWKIPQLLVRLEW